jgi:hypothetical protein
MNPRTRRRLSRRLRHRSRSVAVSVALGVAALTAAYLGTEAALSALGRAPLLLAPADLASAVGEAQPWSITAAALLAVTGVVLLALAVLPGSRARRELADERALIVIDDDVLASGLSRAAASRAGISVAQVRTAVSRRRAAVRVRPSSGFAVDAAATSEAMASTIATLAPRPRLAATASIERTGVLA